MAESIISSRQRTFLSNFIKNIFCSTGGKALKASENTSAIVNLLTHAGRRRKIKEAERQRIADYRGMLQDGLNCIKIFAFLEYSMSFLK
jgi:hypothetical protein